MSFKFTKSLKNLSQKTNIGAFQEKLLEVNSQQIDDIQKMGFSPRKIAKMLEIQINEESQDFVGIQDRSGSAGPRDRFRILTNLDGTQYNDRITINESTQFETDWMDGWGVEYHHTAFGHRGNDTIINNTDDHVVALGGEGTDHYVSTAGGTMHVESLQEGETFTFGAEFHTIGEARGVMTYSNAEGKSQEFSISWGLEMEQTTTQEGHIQIKAVAMS